MKKTVFLLLLLTGLLVPWATHAQTPTILFSEGFDDGVVPEGWTNEYSWDFISRGDGYCARERTGTSDNNKLITPVIDLTTANIARLRFTYAQTVNRGYHDRLQVFYRTAANESWTLLFENTEAVGSYTQVELELPNISSSYQIAFGKNYNYGGGVYLDDVVVDEIPCPRPVGIEVAGFTGTTTTLSWTERGSASAWQICLNGDENNLINASTNPFTLTGLTPETINTAKVRAVCGSDEQSEWSDPVSFEPTDKVVIGPNQEDGSYRGILPCATEYSYSLTEQIYTTAELGAAGTVLSIDFYCINNNNNELSRRLDIYMVPTDQTSFSDAQSYITATEGNCVYSSSYAGSVVFQPGSGWTTIELTTPFNYDGVHNVAILVHDKSEWNVSDAWYYSNVLMFHTFSTGDVSQSIYLTTNNNVGHNPTSTLGTFNPPVQEKNQIRLLKVTCMPPTGLAVDNVTNTTATLSWTERGDATEWVMEYADNSNFNNSQLVDVDDNPTTTISGLNSGTQYYARVRANCGNDDLSPWSNPLVFNTDFCTPSDKCEIFYELTMDYPEPMGLNGDGINVIDNVTGLVIARLTIGNSIYDDNSGEEFVPNTPDETDGVTYARGSFMVCNSRNIRFEWINNDYATAYCSYTFRDLNYNEIEVEVLSGEEEDDDNNEVDNTYFVNCNAYSCLRPTNLAISDVTMEDATLSWTDRNGATSWTLQYCVDFTEEPQEVNVIDNPTYDFEGLESGTTYYVRVKSNCGGDDGESEWSLPFNFTTSLCMPEEMCSISYELHDYGSDGWNGAAINVVDASSGIVLDTWTIGNSGTGFEPLEKMTSGSIEETDGYSYANGTLRVCDGRDIQFVWVSGYDDYSCSYVVYDAEDNVILSSDSENNGDENVKDGEDDENDEDDEETDVLYTYTVDCPPCPKPYDLAVDYEGGTTATVTWTGFANSFDISVNDIVTEDVTSPHMLNLELATTYEVKVRADCGSEDGQSVWSRVVSFTTDLCEDVCEIQYELTDAYGDGWNGNGIQIVDVTTEYIYTTLTIENGSTASGTLRVCNGSEIEFRWVEGSWPDECSYIVYGVNEEVIFSGSDVMGDDVAYMVNCGAGVIDANGWYAISAPYYDEDGSGSSITVANIEGLVPTETGVEYDLFRYNESLAKWENQKGSTETGHLAAGFTTLDCGRGYIYRRSANTILSFDGSPYAGPLSQVQTLTTSCTTDENLKGFNLIGNPYQQPIYKGVNFDYDISPSLVTGFYSLRSDGSWIAHTDDDAIAIGEGVLVKVSGSSPVQLSFYDESEEVGEGPIDDYKKGSAEMNLQFDVKGCGHEDVAYAMLNAQHSEGLPKIAHLNAELPSLSIPQGSDDYAIAMIDGSTQAFPLKFRSIVAGEFTLTMNTKSVFGYLHLVDKVANRDIDLLRQPTYTFAHTGNQALANRFMVKLRPEGENTVDIFAYQNDDRIVVEGTGALQVYDVLGRQLFAHEIESQFSILNSQFPSTGVYILRLNGKSQKIVIK